MSPPADNFTAKIRSTRTAAGRGGFLPVKLSAGGLFWGGSYDGTPT